MSLSTSRRGRAAVAGLVLAGLPVLAAPAGGAPATFSNGTPLTIPSPGQFGPPWKASPYPSTITVSGLSGTVTDINVRLADIDCYQDPPGGPTGGAGEWPDDIDILLVGPIGQDVMLVSDVGGDYNAGQNVEDLNLVLDDEAAVSLPAESPLSVPPSAPLTSGTYKPTDDDDPDELPVDTFSNQRPETPLAARFTGPTPSGSSVLSAFDGTDPNGTWSLYYVDDVAGFERCYVNGGWSLEVTTTTTSLPPGCEQLRNTPAGEVVCRGGPRP